MRNLHSYFLSFLLLLSLPAFAQQNAIFVEGPYGSQQQNSSNEETAQIINLNTKIEELIRSAQREEYKFVQDEATKLLANGVQDSRVERLLALSYERQGNCKNAIYYASQAIARQPSDAQSYAVRANCYYKDGDKLRATEDLERALDLNPNYIFAQELKNLIENGDHQMAQQKDLKQKKKNQLPPWFFVYLFCVLLALGLMVLWHFKTIYALKDKKGTAYTGINIKEKYDFIRQIGEGGMGKVYEAYDNILKRRVAVKRIRPELLTSDHIREQFLSEARMVAMLRHPCIVEIYTVIETANSLYLVFEYVDGQTLETRLDIDNNLTLEQAKKIYSSVCKGLAYAHSKDVVHGDLKPGNIMIADRGVAKVMDFGVAKKVVGGDKKEAKNLAGTPAYMSPEQQKGIMTKQSDIYSLAVCLYETLCGQVPWSIEGFDVETKKIVPLSKLLPNIPPAVDELIQQCLDPEPENRIQTMEEFWERLSKV